MILTVEYLIYPVKYNQFANIAKKELASTNQNQKMSGGTKRRHSSSGFMS